MLLLMGDSSQKGCLRGVVSAIAAQVWLANLVGNIRSGFKLDFHRREWDFGDARTKIIFFLNG
jgi:hypothetical protein